MLSCFGVVRYPFIILPMKYINATIVSLSLCHHLWRPWRCTTPVLPRCSRTWIIGADTDRTDSFWCISHVSWDRSLPSHTLRKYPAVIYMIVSSNTIGCLVSSKHPTNPKWSEGDISGWKPHRLRWTGWKKVQISGGQTISATHSVLFICVWTPETQSKGINIPWRRASKIVLLWTYRLSSSWNTSASHSHITVRQVHYSFTFSPYIVVYFNIDSKRFNVLNGYIEQWV